MSRKTLMFILGLLGAFLTFFGTQFGLAIDSTAMIGGLTVISLYIFSEAKLDIQRVGQQAAKFRDPKFWLAFVVAILTELNASLGLNLPIEVIQTFLGLLLAWLFGSEYKKVKAKSA